VSDDALSSLYRAALALVYPSRYEGFGLPLLEAMASGCPVIASDCASIPEVVGEAGVLLDPDDEVGWAAAIERLVDHPADAERLRTLGLARASLFSWRRTAEGTARVYTECLERAR
jgi:alpha-1,3-rhamnosyl/mannosyltransferase